MYLKTLTLRGFKSFATATTLSFEPGITCIVGPNGSGKSNVVDALTWVMGEQGVKSLRGGKMEDVVFAGTAGRPALGRAEVSLTIDNSDGALPIDYTEVTISRLLFRSGQSEYAINGDRCRLLDLAELLSDTGLGREMHVIVGQGQLDEVLNAGPEARRALIEEAAGVLKHRRRKDKAVRKLDAMQANLTRLTDLTTELGRQLKPLGRQAEIARRAAAIQAGLRDARLRLLADDYVRLAAELARDQADESAAAAQRARLETGLAAARAAEAAQEAAEQLDAPRLAAAQDAFVTLSALAERLRGLLGLATEKQRNLAAPEAPRQAPDPDVMDREAGNLRGQEEELTGRVADAREQLTIAVAARKLAEDALADAERQLAASAKAAARRAEALARLRSQAEAAASRAAAAEGEASRLAEAAGQAAGRSGQAEAEYAALAGRSAPEGARQELVTARKQAAADLAAASSRLTQLRRDEHAASEQRAGLAARAQALTEAVASGADASGVLLAEPRSFAGVLGPLAGLLTVADGAHEAIAAALGTAAGAVAVDSVEAAVEIMTVLRDSGAGQAGLVIAGEGSGTAGLAAEAAQRAPDTVRAAAGLVSGPGELAGALGALLGDVVVVADLAAAAKAISAEPRLRVVTQAGDVLGAHWARGGSAGGQSLISLRAAADEAAAQVADAARRHARAQHKLTAAQAQEEECRAAEAAAAAALSRADAAAAEFSGELGALRGRARAAADEASRLAAAQARAEKAGQAALAAASDARDRLAALEAEEPEAAAVTDDARQELAAGATAARAAETEARLSLRTAEERLAAIAGRADRLASAARAERQAAARAAGRAHRRAEAALRAGAVVAGARVAVASAEASVTAADTQRQAAEEERGRRAGELSQVRARIRDTSRELEKVADSARGAQVASTTRQLQLDQIAAKGLEEFGVEAAALAADYAPDPSFDRAETQKQARQAQRQLDQLGKVNPLALEEFAALQERHAFLVTQLEDLKKTRRDLLTVIREVDDRVQQVFADAYSDIAKEFAVIIARLFPGGDGQLVLTEPDDMLATGIEVEARPPGKKVKRLSLLSGGERSLTAIAFLLAIFRARPSPFYVLDEVEAALDDTNLQRLLDILGELRESSQLIMITHQKRSMEVADTLYGVSMRGDGVSTVVSQRLRERAAV